MKKFEEIGERFGEYLKNKGFGTNEAAKIAGYSGSQISNIIKGKNFGTQILFNILNKFEDLTPEYLFDGKEKPNVKNKLYNESITNSITFPDETKSVENVILSNDDPALYNRMPKVVTVDKQGNDNVILVPVKAAAGYLLGYGDNKFIQSLPTFNLPNVNNGTFRMFQVSGHSMFPTLSDGSYVVGEWVENWVKDLKDNRIYVIVSDDGILVKRVLNRFKKYGNLYLKSDNRKEYPNIALEATDIKEVWTVKMHLSFDLPDPSILYDRVGDLESEIEHIKVQIHNKN